MQFKMINKNCCILKSSIWNVATLNGSSWIVQLNGSTQNDATLNDAFQNDASKKDVTKDDISQMKQLK